jgi:aminomuconate-semialdehyde/2-hydroxymuconate-6-semialdehyde dehydrogenase
VKQLNHFINGRFEKPVAGNYLPVIEPATGHAYADLARGSLEDVQKGVEAAGGAFESWSAFSPGERSDYLHALAAEIDKRMDEFVKAESRDTGKSIQLAREIDIPRAINNFKFFAQLIIGEQSEAHTLPGTINYTHRKPLGPVACISPWNLPIYLLSWKIAPALASGNTVVAKPSEVTPYTAWMLGDVCQAAGLPPGVLNIVQGYGNEVGQALIEHPKIHAISFTGGTATGKKIAATAAPAFKKLSLELGGKNPNIIFADAPYEEMLSTTVRSSFANQGEICLCGSRILVQEEIYNQFKADFIQKVKKIKVGDPTLPDTFMGAIVSERHFRKIQSYLELAKEEGGNILTGGNHLKGQGRCAEGYFIAPTVIEGLSQECRTNQEEIFGPIVTLQPFSDEKEALQLANKSVYGLSATIWTENLSRAHRMAERIEAGIVWVNTWLHRDLRTPFGGTKQSGVGREGGYHALHFFTEPKNICIKYNH